MAVLQKFREKKFLTTGLIAFALLAFIVTGLVSQMRETREIPNAGVVNGDAIDYLQFQKMEETLRTLNPNASQEAVNQQAWQHLSSYALIKKECEKMGLTLGQETFDEIYGDYEAQLMSQLAQANISIKDPQALKSYMQEAMLIGKYNNLISGCLISNDAEVELANKWNNASQKQVSMASLRFDPSQITISDAEKQKRYEEDKELYSFKNMGNEVRNYQLLDIVLKPNSEDISDLRAKMDKYYQSLLSAGKSLEVQNLVKESGSEVAYLGKIYRDIEDFPSAIQTDLRNDESTGTREVKESPDKSAFYTIRVDDIKEYPKEIKYSAFILKKEQANLKDTILAQLNSGKSMEEVASSYKLELVKENNGQNNNAQTPSTTLTLKSAYGQIPVEQQEMAMPMAQLNQQIFDMDPSQNNGVFDLPGNQGSAVIQVKERGEMVKKYQMSAIYKTIGHENAYNAVKKELAAFCSKPHKLENLQADFNKSFSQSSNILMSNVYKMYAESNEFAIMQKAFNPQTQQFGTQAIPNSRDIFDWLFLTAEKAGQTSKVSSFKSNNTLLNREEEHLYAVVFAGKATDYYSRIYNEDIDKDLVSELQREKQAEDYKKKLASCKDMAAAQAIEGVEYQDSTLLASAQDGILFMKASKLSKGQTSGPIVGQFGVYKIRVNSEATQPATSFFGNAQMKKSFADMRAQYYNQGWSAGLIKKSEGFKDERYLRAQ